MTESSDTRRVQELLSAARLLIAQRVDLDAVQVLHVEAARSMGARPPAKYEVLGQARAEQRRLQQMLGQRAAETNGNALQRLLGTLPWWAPRAALAGVAVLLTLRYAWAVTSQENWDRQHPEGNWISRYYGNDRFEGNPMLRYDVGVNADFAAGGPVNNQSKDYFGIRWDVCVKVEREVLLPLKVTADDSARVFVDGELRVAVEPGPGEAKAEVVLQPGVRHLRVEFVERAGMAMVRVDGFDAEGAGGYRFVRPRVEGMALLCSGG